MAKATTIGAQPGPQTKFLSSPADLVIYGGAAGGGKTFAMLMEPLRHVSNGNFGAVILRRTSPQITNEGGLWDESAKLYAGFGAKPNQQRLSWKFPSGSTVTFSSMQHDKDRFQWDGAQIPLIGFDQLEHFSWKQFSYMFSRNRSTCGVHPYIRASCNPDPDHWLRSFLDWWIDDETGLPIEAHSGKIKFFTIIDDVVVWADTKQALLDKYGENTKPTSFTFISSKVTDNRILLNIDPGYLSKLQALPAVERERLEMGNWNVRESAGTVFRREWFDIIDFPGSLTKEVRGWDLAATDRKENEGAAYTVGVRMGYDKMEGNTVIKDVVRMQGTPGEIEKLVQDTAAADGPGVLQSLPQDPGQAGKAQKAHYLKLLMGHNVRITPETGSKIERSNPLSSQAEAGKVKLVRGPWNEPFIRELIGFPEAKLKDQVDGASRAFMEMSRAVAKKKPSAPRIIKLGA